MDNVQLNAPTTAGERIATDEIDGIQHQLVKFEFGENGTAVMVSETNPLPVSASINTTGLATSTGQSLQSTALKQDDIINLLSSINNNISSNSNSDSYASTIILA